jgi:hypothetical protein
MHIKVDITSSTPILSLSRLDIQANTFKILMKANFLAIRLTPFLRQPFYASLKNIFLFFHYHKPRSLLF